MKRIFALCLMLVLIFALFTACGKTEPDRSYEKIVHECDFYSSLDGFDEVLYQFDPVTCYDDVVLHAKQYYYMNCGIINDDPYTVVHNKDSGVWIYFGGNIRYKKLLTDGEASFCGNATDIWEFYDYQFMVTDEGAVIYGLIYDIDGLLKEPVSAEGVEFDLSNEFEFSYENISDYESHTMFIEKLEPVNSIDDVLERAGYLHKRMGEDELNPYAIAYDKENDCWLYYEVAYADNNTMVNFVIDSDGQLLMVYMRET